MRVEEEFGLKPCPFCGGEATLNIAPYIGGAGFGYIVECDKCWSKTGYYSQKAEAVAAWNTRDERTCRYIKDPDTWAELCSECGALAIEDWTADYCWACGAKVVG